MHDDNGEIISRLIDGDLSHDETLDVLKKIQADESLRHKMCRFQGISNAFKADMFYHVSTDFSRKIFQEIQQEPTYFLPQAKPKTSHTQIQDKHSKQKWLALAASVAVVTVMAWQNAHNGQMPYDQQTVTAINIPQQPQPISFPPAINTKHAQSNPLNAQFNDYLQAHNSSVYTNGEANFKPYTRVASYGQD